MERLRAVVIVALFPAFAFAGETTPTMVWTGAAPSGACTGSRVVATAATGLLYCCATGSWAACGSAAGATPGGASGNLQTNNGSGGFGAYAGSTCTAPNVGQTLSASGALGCYQVKLDDVAAPAGNTTVFTMGVKGIGFTFTAPSNSPTLDGAFEIEATGAFSGDLLHVHQHTGNPGAGTDLIHAEFADTDITGLRITGPSSSAQAATITGKVDVTGAVSATSFTGPLTGNVTGTASGNEPTITTLAQTKGGTGAGALTCTNQHLTSNGTAYSCATDVLAGAMHANQGTTTTVLHGNASGNPAWGSVVDGDLSGAVGIAHGGTNNASLGVLAGGLMTADGSKVTQTAQGAQGSIMYNSSANTPAWLTVGAAGTIMVGSATVPKYLAAKSAGQALVGAGAADIVGVAVQTCNTSGGAASSCTITVARSGCLPVCSMSGSGTATVKGTISGTTLTCTFSASATTNACNCFCP